MSIWNMLQGSSDLNSNTIKVHVTACFGDALLKCTVALVKTQKNSKLKLQHIILLVHVQDNRLQRHLCGHYLLYIISQILAP